LLPGMDTLPYFALELGRGCPFSCSFCSTNDFFRRRFRLKSPEVMLAQMKRAKLEFGAKRFDLVHDMFTVDRKRVVAFCQTLIESGEKFRWSCSARTDCIDDDLIELMHRAGCRGVFFGVETGSSRLQQVIDKGLDLEEAAARIRKTTVTGIDTTVSLITGFPEETEEDLWYTVSFLVKAARHELIEPQLHIVAPLAGTPLHNQFRGKLILDGIYSDISFQGGKQHAHESRIIASFPDIFPNFYGVPTAGLERTRVKRLRLFVLRAIERFHWVTAALDQSRGGVRAVFESWDRVSTRVLDDGELERYYASADFITDFSLFVRTAFMRGAASDGALDALLRLAEWIETNHTDACPRFTSEAPVGSPRPPSRKVVPTICADVSIVDLDVDIGPIVRSLRIGDGLPAPSRRQVTIATRPGRPHTTQIMELTPLSASFLKLCDGRTLDRLALALPIDVEFQSLGRAQVAELIFRELCRQRLIVAPQVSKSSSV
jgi:radical SAM family protein